MRLRYEAVLRRFTRLLEMVGVNSVPVLGVFASDWSSATALSVYWAENLIAAVLIGARLWLYRRWSADAAPSLSLTTGPRPVVAQAPGTFLGTAIPFTLAHGVMLGAVFVVVVKASPDMADLQQAIVALLVFQGLAFGIDLWTLDRWPAHRVNERADHLLGRVVLVHLSIIAGMILAAWLDQPGAFFAFFVGCKVLADLTQFLPRINTAPGSAPPRWLSVLMRRFPKKDGLTFDEHWTRSHGGTEILPPPAVPPTTDRPGKPRR